MSNSRTFPVFFGTRLIELLAVLQPFSIGSRRVQIIDAYYKREDSKGEGVDLHCKPDGQWALAFPQMNNYTTWRDLEHAVKRTAPGVRIEMVSGFSPDS